MMKRFLFCVPLLVLLFVGCTTSTSGNPDLYSSAYSNKLTADAANLLAKYQQDALTATAQAPLTNITSTAAAVIVQSTQAAATSQAGITTQTASFVQTQALWTPTPNIQSTATFAALNAINTQIANNTIRDNLVLQRQQTTNDFIASLSQMAPLLVLVLVCGAIIFFLMERARKTRFQTVPVDARGNPLLVLDTVHGTVTDGDRMPNYRGKVTDAILLEFLKWMMEKKTGMTFEQPKITAPRQDQTTERDQMIDMATRGLIPESASDAKNRKKEAGQEAMKLLTGPTLESRFKILDDPTNLPVLDGEIIKVLDDDWKAGLK